jgi:pentose-5-phosphate-3-epimerase
MVSLWDRPWTRAERPARVGRLEQIAGVQLAEAPRPIQVGVDGGVTMANAAEIAGWGADIVVNGSAIYDGADPAGYLGRLPARLRAGPAPGAAAAQHPTPATTGPR